jgi:hypothetical protein
VSADSAFTSSVTRERERERESRGREKPTTVMEKITERKKGSKPERATQ